MNHTGNLRFIPFAGSRFLTRSGRINHDQELTSVTKNMFSSALIFIAGAGVAFSICANFDGHIPAAVPFFRKIEHVIDPIACRSFGMR